MSADLQRRESENGWELRAAWATGRPVNLRLSERAGGLTVLKVVITHVSATDAYVLVGDDQEEPLHVPLMDIEEVTRPHFHEGAPAWRPRGRSGNPLQDVIPGQAVIGEEHAPAVSRPARAAMDRAAGLMLPADLLQTLGALDAVTMGAEKGRRRQYARAAEVAAVVGRSERWTRDRLGLLERVHLVQSYRNGRYLVWRVAR